MLKENFALGKDKHKKKLTQPLFIIGFVPN